MSEEKTNIEISSQESSNQININYSLLLINDYVGRTKNKYPNVYTLPNNDLNYDYIGSINSEIYFYDEEQSKENKNKSDEYFIYNHLIKIIENTINELNSQIRGFFLFYKEEYDNHLYPFLRNYNSRNAKYYEPKNIKINDLKIHISEYKEDNKIKKIVNINGNLYAMKLEILYSKEYQENNEKQSKKLEKLLNPFRDEIVNYRYEECGPEDEETKLKKERIMGLCKQFKNYIKDGVIRTPISRNYLKKSLGSEKNEYTDRLVEWLRCKELELQNKIKNLNLSAEEEEQLLNTKTELVQMIPTIARFDEYSRIGYGTDFLEFEYGIDIRKLSKLFNIINALKSLKYKEQNLIRFPFATNANFNKNEKFNEWLEDLKIIITNVDKCSESYKVADNQMKEMFPNISNKDFIIPEEDLNYSLIKDKIMDIRAVYLSASSELQEATNSLEYLNGGIIRSPIGTNLEFNKKNKDKFNEWLRAMKTILLYEDQCSETYRKVDAQLKSMFPNIANDDYKITDILPDKAYIWMNTDILEKIKKHYLVKNKNISIGKVACQNIGGNLNKTKKYKKRKKNSKSKKYYKI